MEIQNCPDAAIALTYLNLNNWDLLKAIRAYQDSKKQAQKIIKPGQNPAGFGMMQPNNKKDELIIPNVLRSYHFGF